MDTNQIDAACLQSLCELESIWADMETVHNEYLGDSFWNVSQAIMAGRRFEKNSLIKTEQISALNQVLNQQKQELLKSDADLYDANFKIADLSNKINLLITPDALAIVQKAVGVANDALSFVERENAVQAERIIQLESMISKMPVDTPPVEPIEKGGTP